MKHKKKKVTISKIESDYYKERCRRLELIIMMLITAAQQSGEKRFENALRNDYLMLDNDPGTPDAERKRPCYR